MRRVGSGLSNDGSRLSRIRAAFRWNWGNCWGPAGVEIGRKDVVGFVARSGQRGAGTGRRQWSGRSHDRSGGGIKLIRRGREVRRAGNAGRDGRDDRRRDRVEPRDRQRRRCNCPRRVCSKLLRALPIRGRIGKIRCSKQRTLRLENRGKWSIRERRERQRTWHESQQRRHGSWDGRQVVSRFAVSLAAGLCIQIRRLETRAGISVSAHRGFCSYCSRRLSFGLVCRRTVHGRGERGAETRRP